MVTEFLIQFSPFIILLIDDIVVLCLVNQAKVLTLEKKD